MAGKGDTTKRGYGYRHQKRRAKLLRAHDDGTLCDWCGKPMYRDPTSNWDKAPLEADHTEALRDNRDTLNLADRLLHRTCNRQRGAGDDDHAHNMQRMHKGVRGTSRSIFDWGS